MRMADLQAGWIVVGNDGRRLGSIRDVGQNYVLVSIGLASDALHVPASAIGNIEHEVVHLNVSIRDARAMGWEQPPREEDAPESQEPDLHRHV
jgi:hypothetical protein